MQIGVNHFAHFLLFQELKGLLLSSAKSSGTPSRVVNLSSAGHRFSPVVFSDRASLDAWNKGEGYQKWKAYGSAKTANIWVKQNPSMSETFANPFTLLLVRWPTPSTVTTRLKA